MVVSSPSGAGSGRLRVARTLAFGCFFISAVAGALAVQDRVGESAMPWIPVPVLITATPRKVRPSLPTTDHSVGLGVDQVHVEHRLDQCRIVGIVLNDEDERLG